MYNEELIKVSESQKVDLGLFFFSFSFSFQFIFYFGELELGFKHDITCHYHKQSHNKT